MTRPVYGRRRLLALAFALAGASALGCGPSCSCYTPVPEEAELTVYIVRHAEKQQPSAPPTEAGHGDPPLSEAGQRRAVGLIEDLPVRELDAVYVTRTKRSHDTAAAVLALTGLEPIYYPGADVDGLSARLRKRHGQSVLVVGHSNTIPPLLTALGVEPAIEISEDQYGDLWVVNLDADGATLETRRFGESIERFDPGR